MTTEIKSEMEIIQEPDLPDEIVELIELSRRSQRIVFADEPDHWECPQHGQHEATMHIQISGLPTAHFCMMCYVEMLDRDGVCRVTRVCGEE